MTSMMRGIAAAILMLVSAGAASAQPSLSAQQMQQLTQLYDTMRSGLIQEMVNRPRVNPYFARRNAPMTDPQDQALADAGANFKLFQYGRYCGPGWPGGLNARAAGESDTDAKRRRYQNLNRLHAVAAPVDHIDAICFAHDYCYDTIGRDSDLCDYAIMAVLFDSMSAFERANGGEQCANLLVDMAIAFVVKPRSSSGADAALHGFRTYQAYDGLSDGEFEQYLKTKLAAQGVYGYPGQEGRCKLSQDASNPLRGAQSIAEDFSDYTNGKAFRAPGSRAGRGLSLPSFGRAAAQMAVCVAPDGQDDVCEETDRAMITAAWQTLRTAIYTELGARAAAFLAQQTGADEQIEDAGNRLRNFGNRFRRD